MQYVTSDWIDSALPPAFRIESFSVPGPHSDCIYLRALIAAANQAGQQWYGHTRLSPYDASGHDGAITTVFVASGCDWLGLSDDGERLAYARAL